MLLCVVCSDKLLPLLLQHLDSEPGTTQTIACSALLALAYNNHKVRLAVSDILLQCFFKANLPAHFGRVEFWNGRVLFG